MLFYSLFKTLVNERITIELKNGVILEGNLHSVDQYLNVKLVEVKSLESKGRPFYQNCKTCFIRGSCVKYMVLPKEKVKTDLLEEATRRENFNPKRYTR